MKRSEMRTLVLRVGGTNCDGETATAFRDLGTAVDVLHTRKVVKERSLLEYDILVFPGGFAYGDYVRSGVIWAKEVEVSLLDDLQRFVDDGRPVVGICNGFQVLVELGLLPSFRGRSAYPEAALASNSNGYQCRWVHMKSVSKGKCSFAALLPRDLTIRMPVAHGEGRFVFLKEREKECLGLLCEQDQLVLRYAKPDGSFAEDEFPHNPNGAFHDIAGICSPEGNVFGLMPHPERAFYGWQLPDWTKQGKPPEHGDGRLILEAVVEYAQRKL